MTNVNISRTSEKFRMRSEGHAGWGRANGLEEGHDIVCSAISILTQTAAQRFMDMEAEGIVQLVRIHIESGIVDMEVDAEQGAEERVEEMTDTIKTGFELIQQAYPSYLILGWEKTDLACDIV